MITAIERMVVVNKEQEMVVIGERRSIVIANILLHIIIGTYCNIVICKQEDLASEQIFFLKKNSRSQEGKYVDRPKSNNNCIAQLENLSGKHYIKLKKNSVSNYTFFLFFDFYFIFTLFSDSPIAWILITQNLLES